MRNNVKKYFILIDYFSLGKFRNCYKFIIIVEYLGRELSFEKRNGKKVYIN